MNTDEALKIARPCVRNELNRCEQLILSVEKSPAQAHLAKGPYLAAMNSEANQLREVLDYIDGYLGLAPSGEGKS